MPRIYHPGPLAIAATILLSPEASRHLSTVLRKKIGDTITVFNGEGGAYQSKILSQTKNHVQVLVESFNPDECESSLAIHLGQVISRGEKMDFTLQKAVELGVSAITPLYATRCGVKLDVDREAKRLRHWQQIIISACEQCGRNRVPPLHAPQPISNWVTSLNGMPGFVLDPIGAVTLKTIEASHHQLALLIGSEGGLTPDEITFANSQGFTSLQLGPRILRTETAALVALTALQVRFGDLG
jgi:16S rRNA (uracil1498-N3)-methyltransferase